MRSVIPSLARALVLVVLIAGTAAAQRLEVAGQLSVLVDAVPRQDAAELRPRLHVDFSGTPRQGATEVRYRFDVAVEALAATRRGAGVGDGRVDVRDGWVEIATKRIELRAGYGRVIWGRLDEIAPTDVVNPIDVARFLLEGRSEARRAVPFVRARWFVTEDLQVEPVLVAHFRRGTYDALDEPTSPFNPLTTLVLPAGIALSAPEVTHQLPESGVSGGVRVTGTIGRVDVGGAVYRGHEPFGVLGFVPDQGPLVGPQVVGRLVEDHLRFTMIGGDFETVRGEWAFRGEMAAFTERYTFSVNTFSVVPSRSLEGGLGFDRRAGAYRVFGTLLWQHDWSPVDPLLTKTDVNLVGSIDRTFGRDEWLTRGFVVVNPADGSAFVRGVVIWRPRDAVAFEASAGGFAGTSDDTLGQFKGRDFVFGRMTYFF